jgi:FdhE protein
MTEGATLQPDPTKIGEVSAPPFAVLPNPEELFRRREERLRALAVDAPLAPFLLFLAALVRAQRMALATLPNIAVPAEADLARAREFAMPPINRARLAADPALSATMGALFDAAAEIDMPDASRAALAALRQGGEERRDALLRALLEEDHAEHNPAEALFVAAAAQIHMARLAHRLDAAALAPIGDGVCPACGGRACASMVVGWHGAHGTRFCACAMCGTLWHYVRIRCIACGTTKGVSYSAPESGDGATKAECCTECGSYVKIFHQTLSPDVEPVADDVASLGLDMLMRGEKLRRAGFNPFLLGY